MNRQQHQHLIALITAAAALLAYLNTCWNGYALDDAAVITNNPLVQQGIKGIPGIFGSDVWQFHNIQLGYYRPLSVATFAIEQSLTGGHAAVSHAINTLLFSATCYLLTHLLFVLFPGSNPLLIALSILLFAWHPIHTEVVANLKGRDEILSFLFLLGAVTTFLSYLKKNSKSYMWLAASLCLYYLALLSKETALIGVIFIPAAAWWCGIRNVPVLMRYGALFVAVVLLFQLQKYVVLGGGIAVPLNDLVNYPYITISQRIAAVFYFITLSFQKLLIPYPLLYSYAYNEVAVTSLMHWQVIAGIVLAAGAVFFILRSYKREPTLAAGISIILLFLLPLAGFVLLRGGIFAERFLYAPSLGFCLVVSSVFLKYLNIPLQTETVAGKQFKVALPVGMLPLFALLALTINRNSHWKNNISLFEHDASLAPQNVQIQCHYSTQLNRLAVNETNEPQRTNYLKLSAQALHKALSVYPGFTEALYEAGVHMQLSGNIDSAVLYYQLATQQGTNNELPWLALAQIYESGAKPKMASYYYEKAAQLNPSNSHVVALRNNYRSKTGLQVTAFPSDENAPAAESNDLSKGYDYYFETGTRYGQTGDFDNALSCFEKCLVLRPQSEDVLNNMGLCYWGKKDYLNSAAAFEKVLAVNPSNQLALQNLMLLYQKTGKPEKAAALKQRLVKP